MSGIAYVRGDATQPAGDDRKILVHGVNDLGRWASGFVLAVSARWPEPEREYLAWAARRTNPDFELGAVQYVKVAPNLCVANLISQHGVFHWQYNPIPVRYPAIRTGLTTIAAFAQKHGASVHMPRIGAGKARGDWRQIEPLIVQTLIAQGVAVTVYDQ